MGINEVSLSDVVDDENPYDVALAIMHAIDNGQVFDDICDKKDVKKLVKNMGIDKHEVLQILTEGAILNCYDYLTKELGLDVDLEKIRDDLVDQPVVLASYLDVFNQNGVHVKADGLLDQMDDGDVDSFADVLLRNGANVTNVMYSLPEQRLSAHIDQLLSYGVDPDELVELLPEDAVDAHMEMFLIHGVDKCLFVDGISLSGAICNASLLRKHGIGRKAILAHFDWWSLAMYRNEVKDAFGISDDDILKRAPSSEEICKRTRTLLAWELNPTCLVIHMTPYDVNIVKDWLIDAGVNMKVLNESLSKLKMADPD